MDFAVAVALREQCDEGRIRAITAVQRLDGSPALIDALRQALSPLVNLSHKAPPVGKALSRAIGTFTQLIPAVEWPLGISREASFDYIEYKPDPSRTWRSLCPPHFELGITQEWDRAVTYYSSLFGSR